MKKGLDFENNLVKFFREQGYLTRRGIPLVIDNEQDATDIDVYGINFTYPFIENNVVCDCKNKAKPKPFERLFWTKGMAEYVRVENVYIALPKVQNKVVKFASSIGVNVITKDKLAAKDYKKYNYGLSFSITKDKKIEELYRKIKQLYVVKNPYIIFNKCVNELCYLRQLQGEDKYNKDDLNIILFEIVLLITVSLLRMCSKLISFDSIEIRNEIEQKLTYGEIPEQKINSLLENLSKLSTEIIKSKTGKYLNLFDEYNFVKPPLYVNDVIGLIERIIMNPKDYIKLPQITDYILYNNIFEGKEFNENDFRSLFGEERYKEKIKAFKNIIIFLNQHFCINIDLDSIFK